MDREQTVFRTTGLCRSYEVIQGTQKKTGVQNGYYIDTALQNCGMVLPLQNKSGIFWLIPEFFLEYDRKDF